MSKVPKYLELKTHLYITHGLKKSKVKSEYIFTAWKWKHGILKFVCYS